MANFSAKKSFHFRQGNLEVTAFLTFEASRHMHDKGLRDFSCGGKPLSQEIEIRSDIKFTKIVVLQIGTKILITGVNEI